MNEVLNNYGIPNEVGFVIIPKTLENCFDKKSDYEQSIHSINEFYNQIIKSFINGEIDFKIGVELSVQSFNGQKIIRCDEFQAIKQVYGYFNAKYDYKGDIHFNNDEEKKSLVKQDIKDLKLFLRKKIEALSNVKSVEDLKEISLLLYMDYMRAYYEDKDGWYFFFKNEIQRDIKTFKTLNIWLKKFIEEVSKPLPFEFFTNINRDKFKLVVAYQYLILSISLKEPNRSILIDSAKKIYSSIEDKNIKLDSVIIWRPNIDFDNNEQVSEYLIENFDTRSFEELYESIISDNELNQSVSSISKINSEDYENMNFRTMYDFLINTINQSLALGSEEIKDTEITNKIDEIQNEITSGNLSLDEYKQKKHQLQKLKMVFQNIKPKAIQKGIGVFQGFNVYYYLNGMVAIDKIDYGARLFVMPISTYKYIIENDVKSLRQIGKMDGVKAFKHDERTDWLSRAKDTILTGTSAITNNDIEISEKMISWDFDYTDLDITRLSELIENIQNNEEYSELEKEKKIKELTEESEKKKQDQEKKKKRAREIDNELKSSQPEEDLKRSEELELKNYEAILDEEFGYETDFQQLYEAFQKIGKKSKRNPAVAKYCKDRTMNANGMYHCEMCNTEYSIEEKHRLDFHHFIAIGEGGPDTIYNGLCLCTECHRIIHFEKERITSKSKVEFLQKIEKHLKDGNPEYLEEFYEYKRKYFPTINDLIYAKRKEIQTDLEDEGLTEDEYGHEIISEEIDARIKIFEEKLEADYKADPNKYNESFEIDWHSNKNVKR